MLPEEFLNRMEVMLGGELPLFLNSYESTRFQGLRINTLKKRKGEESVQFPFSLKQIPWCREGFYYEETDRPGMHPYHDAGVYYIQEPSAMAPVEYLKPEPGERVLDLCAAPGGKSTQIAMKMQNQGLLVCNEIHGGRAKILSENIERMGITNAVVTNETPQKLEQTFPQYFHRILVDAPCSGEGMFRKNQEAILEWSLENVELCARRQDEILSCAATMLKPGGRLVYSTCTFAPLENEGTIQRFLKNHLDFSIESVELLEGMTPGNPQWIENPCETLTNTIRLWPHKLSGEGHFLAVLKKNQKEEQEGIQKVQEWEKNPEKGKRKKKIPSQSEKQKEYPVWEEFRKENLSESFSGKIVAFGEQLYLIPEEMVSLRGLKVLRPGLHIGSYKKNHFIPSHALALALDPKEVKHCLNLPGDSQEVFSYLKGETLTVSGEKGWYLITVDGYGIGWGKLSGTTMKNHYPKGLRRM